MKIIVKEVPSVQPERSPSCNSVELVPRSSRPVKPTPGCVLLALYFFVCVVFFCLLCTFLFAFSFFVCVIFFVCVFLFLFALYFFVCVVLFC